MQDKVGGGQFYIDTSRVDIDGTNAVIDFDDKATYKLVHQTQMQARTRKDYEVLSVSGQDMVDACNRGITLTREREKNMYKNMRDDILTESKCFFIRAKASNITDLGDGTSIVSGVPIVHHGEIQRGTMFVDSSNVRADAATNKALVGLGSASDSVRIVMDGSDHSLKDASPIDIVDMQNAARLYGGLYPDGREGEKKQQKCLNVGEKDIANVGDNLNFVKFPIEHHGELQTGMINVTDDCITRDEKGGVTVTLDQDKYNLTMTGDNDYAAYKTVTADTLVDMHDKGVELQKAAERAKIADANLAAIQEEYGSDGVSLE
jgi:hypothetical protein